MGLHSMIIDKGDSMIDETQLTKDEAEAFIECMLIESERHEVAKLEAQAMCAIYFDADSVHATFWRFAVVRHQQDIDMIWRSIAYLQQKHQINQVN